MRPLVPLPAQPPSPDLTPEEVSWLRAELDALRVVPELTAFAPHHDALVAHVVAHEGATLLAERREQQRALEHRRRADVEQGRRTRALRVVAWVVAVAWLVLFGFAAAIYAVTVVVPFGGMTRLSAALALLLDLVIALPAVVGVWALRRTSPRRRLAAELENRESLQRLDQRRTLTEAYRRAIDAVLGAQSLAPFPVQAPELVETSGGEVIATRAIRQVRDFVQEHSTSAIGVAGPRGVGKTTLLSRLGPPETTTVVPVAVSNTIEGADFLRRVAYALDGALNPRDARAPGLRPRALSRIALAAAVGVGGAVMVALDVLDPPLLAEVGALGATGALVLLVALLMTTSTLLQGRLEPGVDLGRSGAARGAAALARDVGREVSESRGEGVSLTLASVLGLERSRERSDTVRELGYAALVHRLREVLGLAGLEAQESGRRVVVVVDELDKLAQLDALVTVVNTAKDLFGVPGVHFVLSVSDEALTSFTLRGLQPRDAFDSSFDVVVELQRLGSDEALEVLRSRVVGFPPALGRLCHVWAGGLPRDLIRAARECVELQRERGGEPAWPQLARAFLERDLERRVAALRAQGWLVNDAPVEEARRRIAQGDEISGLRRVRASGTALGNALRMVDHCVSALRLLELQPEPGGHDLERLDGLALAVSQLTSRPPLGIAGVDQDQVTGSSTTTTTTA